MEQSNKETPFSTVGYLVMKRTYARRLDADDPNSMTEEWEDVVNRVVEAAETQLKVGYTPEEQERFKGHMMALRGVPAGRFMWQLGTATVDRLGQPSLQNCAAVVVDEPVRPFTWAMDRLMLGCGVGFNIQKEFVYELPKVREDFKPPTRHDHSDADFILADTRESWIKLLEYTLRSAFEKDAKRGFKFSTQLVRGKGEPIKGFGGVSSGPAELVKGILQIAEVLEARKGKKLRPIDCLDIFCLIGQIVVSGNVRRSALLALGDPDDMLYLRAKNWGSGKIPNWRSNANLSVACSDIRHLPAEFWKTYDGSSEAYGLINLKLSRSCGRAGDKRYTDKGVIAYNPCAEQSLEDYETCCLGIGFLPMFESYEQMLDWAILLYRLCKHSLALPDTTSEETQAIVNKNMRMGLDFICGYLQATEEQRGWLPQLYEDLRAFDVEYSAKMGWPVSIKLTTAKPNGSVSLMPGVPAGVHPAYATYMIRRIRISSNHPLVDVCREHGYKVEYLRTLEGTEDRGTVVVEFPYAHPESTVVAKDMTAIDQLEVVKRVQAEWSDNSVSCTIYYRPEELPAIREYLEANYNKNFKTLSFMLLNEHGFDQPPIEAITKEEYEKIVKRTRVITRIEREVEVDDTDCESGACPVR